MSEQNEKVEIDVEMRVKINLAAREYLRLKKELNRIENQFEEVEKELHSLIPNGARVVMEEDFWGNWWEFCHASRKDLGVDLICRRVHKV